MRSRRQHDLRLFGKWSCYTLALLLAAVLQTTPGFLTVAGAKPVFILPLCLAVAVYEGEFRGALFGALGGLLWDYTAGRVAGLLALALLIVCFFASVLVQLFLRVNHMNFILISGVCCLLVTGIDFVSNYWMRGYSGAGWYYFTVVMPTAIFTSAAAPLSFLLARRIFRAFVDPET